MLAHFFLDSQVLVEEKREIFPLALSAQDAKHVRALRLSAGEHIVVVDASSDYFECEIVSFLDKVPLVHIAAHCDQGLSGPSVTLIQGLAKGDKMDTIVRHATEVGIHRFIPLMCERSVVKLDAKKAAARTQRWRSIAKSAAMQAGRKKVPEIISPLCLDELRSNLAAINTLLVCWEEAPKNARLYDVLAGMGISAKNNDSRVGIVVGPEGGLTTAEVRGLLSLVPHASPVSLGPTILRTETAGIVAPALVLYEISRLEGQFGVGDPSSRQVCV